MYRYRCTCFKYLRRTQLVIFTVYLFYDCVLKYETLTHILQDHFVFRLSASISTTFFSRTFGRIKFKVVSIITSAVLIYYRFEKIMLHFWFISLLFSVFWAVAAVVDLSGLVWSVKMPDRNQQSITKIKINAGLLTFYGISMWNYC